MSAKFIICVISLIVNIECKCNPNYFIPRSPPTATRFQAKQICQSKGADLVSIGTEEEAYELFSRMLEIGDRDTYYWTSGISYWKATESKWWFDSTGTEARHTQWCQPNQQPEEQSGTKTYGEPCLAMNYQGDNICWHDYPCFTQMAYVCVEPCIPPDTQPMVPFGEFCIYYDFQNQEGAQKQCEAKSHGKSLLSVDSVVKLNRLIWYFGFYARRGIRFWSGLKRVANYSDQWAWNSGQGAVATWINWRSDRQNNPARNCGMMEKSSETFIFLAYQCDPYLKYYYICE